MEIFNWSEPQKITHIPKRPFIGKIPMEMVFIDARCQAFKFIKETGKFVYLYSSFTI